MSSVIYLVRHGFTEANKVHAMDTRFPGADLAEEGRAQAESLVEYFADIELGGIHASNLVRTQQTATPLAQARGLEIQIHPGLRELCIGEMEGSTDPDDTTRYREQYRRWIEEDPDVPLPGGESATDTLLRADAAIATIASDTPQVVVSHGSTIRLWVALRCSNVDPAIGLDYIENTAVIKVVGSPGAWEMEFWDQRGPIVENPHPGLLPSQR